MTEIGSDFYGSYEVTFSADSNWILVSVARTGWRLYRSADGSEAHVAEHNNSANVDFRGANFAAHDRFIADRTHVGYSSGALGAEVSHTNGIVELTEIGTWKVSDRIIHGGGTDAVVDLPSPNRLLTAGGDGRAVIWDLSTMKPLHVFRHQGQNEFGETHTVSGAIVSSDGRQALTWSDDHTARLWDIDSSEPLIVFKHDDDVQCASVDFESGRVLTATYDKVYLWSRGRHQPMRRTQLARMIDDVVLFDSGRRYLVSFDEAGNGTTVDGKRAEPRSRLTSVWDVVRERHRDDIRNRWAEISGTQIDATGQYVVTPAPPDTHIEAP